MSHRIVFPWRVPLVLALTLVVLAPPAILAQSAALEESGVEPEPSILPTPDPDAREIARGMLATGLLLIPESSNDRVMAFDPMTGDLVDADFIPADPTNLSTPIHAILNSTSDGILVSDQIEDVVQQYDLDGNYVGIFAPAGGVDNSILDNIRGISLRPNGNLLVTVGGGANDDAVAEFDTAGNSVGNFVANGAGGLDSPFDVYMRTSDYLVGGITSDAIHSYDLTGAALPDFSPLDTFPEQIAEAGNGNVLVGNFIGTQEGVVELSPDGMTIVGIYDPAAVGGNRGVYELPNGNILTTNGSGVHEIDRMGNLVETKIAGVSARFIELVQTGGGEADLEITKTLESPGIVQPGEPVTLVLTVTNLGPDDATNVVVTDDLPAGMLFTGDDCGGTFVDPTFTWMIPMLAASASAECRITVVIDQEGAIANTATVSADQNDPVPANDTGTLVVVVQTSVLAIPTLGTVGLALLALLLVVSAGLLLRRRLG